MSVIFLFRKVWNNFWGQRYSSQFYFDKDEEYFLPYHDQYLVSDEGYHPSIDGPVFLTGKLYRVPTNAYVYSLSDGSVKFNANGLVAIDHDDGYTTYHYPVKSTIVKPNQRVSKGEVLGSVESILKSLLPGDVLLSQSLYITGLPVHSLGVLKKALIPLSCSYSASGPWHNQYTYVPPIPGDAPFSSEYGPRKLRGGFHYGYDYKVPTGTPVQTMLYGTVIRNKPHKDYGEMVVVKQDDGSVVIYGHLSKTLVEPGERVSTGQIIGISGNTGGVSTGPHLHVAVLELAPDALILDEGKLGVREGDYAVDFMERIPFSSERIDHFLDEMSKKETPLGFDHDYGLNSVSSYTEGQEVTDQDIAGDQDDRGTDTADRKEDDLNIEDSSIGPEPGDGLDSDPTEQPGSLTSCPSDCNGDDLGNAPSGSPTIKIIIEEPYIITPKGTECSGSKSSEYDPTDSQHDDPAPSSNNDNDPYFP